VQEQSSNFSPPAFKIVRPQPPETQMKEAVATVGRNPLLMKAPPWRNPRGIDDNVEAGVLRGTKGRLGVLGRNSWTIGSVKPRAKLCPGCNSLILAGMLDGRECDYFVDSGASGKFVSTQYVNKNGWGTRCSTMESPLVVRLADGSELTTTTVLKAAQFSGVGGGNPVLYGAHDLAVIPLDGYDVILGMPWLRSTNPVIDWEHGTVESRLPSSAEVNSMQRTSSSDDCISPEDTTAFEESIVDVPTAMTNLLKRYRHIFRETLPAGLPMKRPIEHHIKLKAGSQPRAIKQWRLSPKNIEEQDKQCAKALAARHVRSSTSPYNAPSVFIPKPDGSCRWCQDYRPVNTDTEKNKISMPRVDDLFDRIRARWYTC
jgi:hypothetical protein